MLSTRLTAFLELDDPHEGAGLSKDAVLRDFPDDALQLKVEDPGDQIRSVLGLLSGQQGFGYLRPLRVACDGNEECWLPECPHDGHGIHVPIGM